MHYQIAPGINGERGIEKIRAERGVLLLRERTSPFIEQFKHPIGRCAKFYKLTAHNNCNFWCEQVHRAQGSHYKYHPQYQFQCLHQVIDPNHLSPHPEDRRAEALL